jgi:hypothetical protein
MNQPATRSLVSGGGAVGGDAATSATDKFSYGANWGVTTGVSDMYAKTANWTFTSGASATLTFYEEQQRRQPVLSRRLA